MLKKLQVALIRRFTRKRLGKDIAPLETIAAHPDVLIPYAKFSMALEKNQPGSGKTENPGTDSRGQTGGISFLNRH